MSTNSRYIVGPVADMAIYGGSMGLGTYGLLKLIREASKNLVPEKDPETLTVPLPKSRFTPEEEELQLKAAAEKLASSPILETGMDTVTPLLMFLGAGAGGFYGGSKLVNTIEKHQKEKELEKVKAQYLAALSGQQNNPADGVKMATELVKESETPCLDSLCEGLASMSKEAGIGDLFRKLGPVISNMRNSNVAKHLQRNAVPYGMASGIAGVGGLEMLHNSVTNGGTAPNVFEGASSRVATKLPLSKEVMATATALALLSGAGTYGIGSYVKNKQKKEKQKAILPQKVQLELV